VKIERIKSAYWRSRILLDKKVKLTRHKLLRKKHPIPTVGITGSLGKTTTCRMVAHIFTESGKVVALSTTQGAWIGDETIKIADCSRGDLAMELFLDPRSEAGVFELARGSLIDRGVVLDSVDVGVVLNVYDNHLGLQGINTREDLARVKRLVLEKARDVAVVNADDPLCMAMREVVTAPRICLVTLGPANAIIQQHQEAGGMVAYVEESHGDASLVMYDGTRLLSSIPASEVPVTWGGQFRPGISNALFAMAVAHSHRIDTTTIRRALRSFRSDHQQNPGRMNFVANLPYQLCITWADGPEAMRALAALFRDLKISGNKYLMMSAMGNRPDSFIKAQAEAVAGVFTQYIFSDWEDLRGRRPREVAKLLASGALEAGDPEERITTAPSHAEALECAFARAEVGDLLVIVTYSGQKAWEKATALGGS